MVTIWGSSSCSRWMSALLPFIVLTTLQSWGSPERRTVSLISTVFIALLSKQGESGWDFPKSVSQPAAARGNLSTATENSNHTQFPAPSASCFYSLTANQAFLSIGYWPQSAVAANPSTGTLSSCLKTGHCDYLIDLAPIRELCLRLRALSVLCAAHLGQGGVVAHRPSSAGIQQAEFSH